MKAEDGMEVRPFRVSLFLPGSTNSICQLSPPILLTPFIILFLSPGGRRRQSVDWTWTNFHCAFCLGVGCFIFFWIFLLLRYKNWQKGKKYILSILCIIDESHHDMNIEPSKYPTYFLNPSGCICPWRMR